MQIKKITDKGLKSLKATGKRYEVSTGDNYPGLFLRVSASGGIAFWYRFQLEGIRRKMVVGKFPATSLHDLFTEYNSLVAHVRRGDDPLFMREQAQKLAHAKQEAIEAEIRKEGQRPTFKSLWGDYSQTLKKSLAADRSRFENHLKDIHDKIPDELITLDIERIKNRLKKAKLSPQTIKHCLTLIDRIVNYGFDQEPPRCKQLSFKIKKPSFDNQVTEVLNDNQLQSLLRVIDADLERDPFSGRVMLLALATGMRRGAMIRLKWTDIDYTTGFIVLRDAKSRKAHKKHNIPLNEAAKSILKSVPRTGSPYVFPGEKKDGIWQPRADFNRGTRRIKKAAGLPEDFRPLHGLRHHYGSALTSSGVELYTVQKLLTHADPSTTQRYAHLSDDRLKAGAAVADGLIKRKEAKHNVITLLKD